MRGPLRSGHVLLLDPSGTFFGLLCENCWAVHL